MDQLDSIVIDDDVEDLNSYDDRNNQVIRNWYAGLASRYNLIGEFYPFIVNEKEGTIQLKPNLTNSNKLYIYLLLAGSLRIFSKQVQGKLTADFEFLSIEAQTRMFPQLSNGITSYTYGFGKNPEGTGIFVGSLENKLKTLAEKISCKNLETSYIGQLNSGDYGLDVISFIKFDDDVFGLPVIIAQSACSYQDWIKKQWDHHPGRYRALNIFPFDYIRLMMIPFYYRDNNGQWFNPSVIYQTVIIDRLRFIKIFHNDDVLSERINAWVNLILEDDERTREIRAIEIVNRTVAA
ncbi:MAG: hypothetical protein COW65_11695 [Cytophagales bacterium CG18_big_fil_WC_8_21_14_2_50_42_9]|nr:MAG: hypothetical protein COW65_11695 [Cytophagales bacterium CG18_big_fil_WC_8_21_14_2_50_42_9]